ncbi:MAG: UMP kinase [Planctomycetota bacterium]|nr:UMP kinase [Planctomycetota bacterium]
MDHGATRRVLLKLSGEALGGAAGVGLDFQALRTVSEQISRAASLNTEIAIVVGAGNLCRGADWSSEKLHRSDADAIGMTATHVNALALRAHLQMQDCPAVVLGAGSPVPQIQRFHSGEARQLLSLGTTVVLSGGTGNPYFTTDTCAALRAAELDCGELLKGTKHDGIYDQDPARYPEANKLETTTFDHVLEAGLKAMDTSAFTLCRDQRISLRIFDMTRENAIYEAITGVAVGSLIES